MTTTSAEETELLFTPEIQQLTKELFELIPGLFLIAPGERQIRPLSSTSDPGHLSPKGRDQCQALRDRSWFTTLARSLQIIVTANNACALESAQQMIIPYNRTITYRSLPSLWPLTSGPTGPTAITHTDIERAIREIIAVARGNTFLIGELALVIVTQMGVEPTRGPELPTAILASLGFPKRAQRLKAKPLRPCQAVLITKDKTEVVW